MNSIVIFTAIVGFATAAPGLYFTPETHDYPLYHTQTISSPSKTTITKSSQVVNHGGHEILHVPIQHDIHTLIHEPIHSLIHEPIHSLVHEPIHTLVQPIHHYKEPATSSQYFKLENKHYDSHDVIAPIHSYGYEVAPVIDSYHAPLVSRTGDSAISHQSSTTHETVPEIQSLPLYSLHH